MELKTALRSHLTQSEPLPQAMAVGVVGQSLYTASGGKSWHKYGRQKDFFRKQNLAYAPVKILSDRHPKDSQSTHYRDTWVPLFAGAFECSS